MIMVAWHQPPSDRRPGHTRQSLRDNAVAWLNIVEHVASDDNMRSLLGFCLRAEAVYGIETGLG